MEDTYEAPEHEPKREDASPETIRPVRYTRSGRRTTSYVEPSWDDDEEATVHARPRRSTRVSKSLRDFVASDEDEEEDDNADYAETIRARHAKERAERARRRENLMNLAASRSSRRLAQQAGSESSAESDDHEEPEHRSYSFRARKKINYSLVAPPAEPLRDGFGRRIRRTSSRSHSVRATERDHDNDGTYTTRFPRLPSLPFSSLPRQRSGREGWDGLPLSMTGKDYADAFGDMDSSDDEPPRANLTGNTGGHVLGGASANSMLENGPAPAPGGGLGSSTDAFGRLTRESDPLADIDPLGVNMDVNFDQVGGLEDHVQQLKEMVSLPLLYPEVFQRFGVTPPRGVLFHGPPGTGKTLVARALAASCSTDGHKISFFMRKGADCLSKWVGEAERQLRLLFEEAKRSQPSIIFFDEIDGLAPVRSSKQDQIHASIVSTLLALMDGMDGRGQVVVIGATNRPDSIDPALRRPGRFDREFYFPLPSRAARLSIISIHTSRWEPPLDAALQEVLADATNGFGGADLRALCTEATLNAIQRRYPQIYRTTDRLLLAPETIQVDGRDFMLALEKMVPSSARSTKAASSPLPPHMTPLLRASVDTCEALLQRILPRRAKRNALDEALYETESHWPDQAPVTAAGMLERELLQQSLAQAQVHRPRLLLHGKAGMGQRLVAEAVLHALEGYHIVTLTAAQLLGDSTQTPESILVQQFQEAKRLMPSVVYVPDVDRWPLLLTDQVREVVGALLHGLQASDAMMLFATSEVPWTELPHDIQGWFGYRPLHKYALTSPSDVQRTLFFQDVARQAARPPTEFADAMPRKRRVLEELPKAPPRPPRMPTTVELSQQVENDARLLEHLKFRLGTILSELRKKYKKFTRDVWDEYNLRELMEQFTWRREKGKIVITLRYDRHASHESEAEAASESDVEAGAEAEAGADADADAPASPPAAPAPQDEAELEPSTTTEDPADEAMRDDVPSPADKAEERYILRDFTIYTMSLDKMQKRLYHNQYLTCDDFMADLNKIVSNAEEASEVDADRVFRAHQMQNLATILMDQYVESSFRTECQAMAQRVLAREEQARKEAEKKKDELVHHRRPDGVRYSARVQGEEPDARHLVDVSTIERATKRARTTSRPGSEEPAETETPGPAPMPMEEPASTLEPAIEAEPVPHRSALLDDAAQASLVASLVDLTQTLNVEQLEQARAACYERIMAHRASWDRAPLLHDLVDVVRELSQAIHAAQTIVPSS
ncbi:TAT-binding protein-like protein 7, AAA ATPase [Malassezia pachydermatis]